MTVTNIIFIITVPDQILRPPQLSETVFTVINAVQINPKSTTN